MNPPSNRPLSGTSPSVPPPPTEVTITRRQALCAFGLLLLLSFGVSLAVVWAVPRMIPVGDPAGLAREIWEPFMLLGPALTVAFMFWRQHRKVDSSVNRPVFVLGLFLAIPLAAMAGLLVAMALSGWLTVGWPTGLIQFQDGLVYLGVGVIVSTLLWWGWRNRWRKLAVTAVSTCLLTVWLVWDEPASATPLDVDVLAPLPPRAAESHAVAVWSQAGSNSMAPDSWLGRARNYFGTPPRPDEWRAFVVANREVIRADWTARTAARDWIARLDAFDRVGDLAKVYKPSPRINDQLFRDTVFLCCAYASLLAIEGRDDEALEVLRPTLSVSRKLQFSARLLRTYLIGIIGQQMCQNAGQFVMNATTPSAHALRQFGAVLTPADDLAVTYQRVFLCDCADWLHMLSDLRRESTRWEWWLARLAYNPNATANLASRSIRKLLAVAMEGRSEGLRAHEQAAKRKGLGTRTFKNLAGHWLVWKGVLVFTPVVSRSIATADQRRALLAEVQVKLAAAVKGAKEGAGTAAPKAKEP